jgi:hypothetical protein
MVDVNEARRVLAEDEAAARRSADREAKERARQEARRPEVEKAVAQLPELLGIPMPAPHPADCACLGCKRRLAGEAIQALWAAPAGTRIQRAPTPPPPPPTREELAAKRSKLLQLEAAEAAADARAIRAELAALRREMGLDK